MRPLRPARTTIWLFVGAVVFSGCAPSVADQHEAPATIGILRAVPIPHHDAFIEQLKALGWSLRGNLRILPSDMGDLYETDEQAMAAIRAWQQDDLDLIIAFSTPHAQLVADRTSTPTLFVVNDPLASELVTDLDEPDGHLTGVTWKVPADRTLDIASRALGGLPRVGYLYPQGDPAVPGHRARVLTAAQMLEIEIVEEAFAGSDPNTVAAAVETLAAAGVGAIYLTSSTATAQALDQLEEELDRHALPAISNVEFVDFAVVKVAPDIVEINRQLARQAARVLAGSDVASVPVEDPRRFVITIDRTKAASLGRPIAAEILQEADVVR